jgi:hypothetical protein
MLFCPFGRRPPLEVWLVLDLTYLVQQIAAFVMYTVENMSRIRLRAIIRKKVLPFPAKKRCPWELSHGIIGV